MLGGRHVNSTSASKEQDVLPSDARAILTPSQLNALARDLLEGAFPLIWVEGELSGVSRPGSGHIYFTLKDVRAQVRCALFKPRSQRLPFQPVDGMNVLLRARLTVYEARGDYQLIVDHMEEAGEGALRRAFELLKARLAEEGLFDPARRRALPRFVRRIGVITSPDGAAVRDVLSVMRRRFALVQVELLPVLVQGTNAARQIADMLQRADRSGRYDVLLLTRGGGSLEDLQAFNEEIVARAVAASSTPTVAAIGHESDISIVDLVADVRAPTPSAAAELLTPDASEIRNWLQQRVGDLARIQRRGLTQRAQRVDQLYLRLQSQRPAARLLQGRERLAMLHTRLQQQSRSALARVREACRRFAPRLQRIHPRIRIPLLQQRLSQARQHYAAGVARVLETRTLHLRSLGRALNAVSPLATLERGYAILHDENGLVLRHAADAHAGQKLRARLVDGELGLLVSSALPQSKDTQ